MRDHKNQNNFKKYITENKIVPYGKVDEAFKFFNKVKFKKGQHFDSLKRNQDQIGFIEKGLVVYYTYIDGEKQVTDILTEGDWLALFDQQKPSNVYIEFLEDVEIWLINGQQMEKLTILFPNVLSFKSTVIHQYLTLMTERFLDRSAINAEQRLQKFSSKDISLINRLPQSYLASFLGIKPQSLSRIKKSIRYTF